MRSNSAGIAEGIPGGRPKIVPNPELILERLPGEFQNEFLEESWKVFLDKFWKQLLEISQRKHLELEESRKKS